MLNQEILTKAIQKAIDSGLDWIGWSDYEYISQKTSDVVTVVAGKNVFDISIRDIIFNHDFAKALWGEVVEDMPHDGNFDTDDYSQWFLQVAWQYHLKQMVIAEDPIKYLGEHLNDTNP